MAKGDKVVRIHKEKVKVRRPGIHAKNEHSGNKRSKTYVKPYNGQGR